MPDKMIFCDKCHIPLGVIRDARLKIGIIFICSSCKETKPQNNSMPDFMKGIFNSK